MTNETTASQPKSIGDDAEFQSLLYRYRQCFVSAETVIAYIDNFRASAAQASATIQAAPTGMHAAADLIDAKAQKYLDDHAGTENDTGAVVFHYGEAGRDYHSTLVELAEELRLAATIQQHVMVAEPVGEELHFNAQRLRNVAVLVGLTGAIPDDDATLDGARGAVLGMIAGRLRGEAKIDALAAPMVADPAGVANSPIGYISQDALTELQDSGAPADSLLTLRHSKSTHRRAEIPVYLAATVKAVPSEWLSPAHAAVTPMFLLNAAYCIEAPHEVATSRKREVLDSLHRVANELQAERNESRKALFAAPLADKTGGGE